MTWEEALEAHVQENKQEFLGIGQTFSELREFVSEQIGKVNGRIEQLDTTLNGRIADLDKKLSDLDAKIGGRITALETTMTFSFDEMRQRLNRRFERVDAQLELLLKGLLNGPR